MTRQASILAIRVRGSRKQTIRKASLQEVASRCLILAAGDRDVKGDGYTLLARGLITISLSHPYHATHT